MESLVDGGGICISGTAFDQVKGKLEVGYKYLGEQSVKNIKEPVRVYRMLLEPDAAGKIIGDKKSKQNHRKWAVVTVSAIIILLAGAYFIWNLYFRSSTSSKRLSPTLTTDSELSKIPSVAILPFDNLSDDPDQAYFTDGMTDDLITGLSKLTGLLVIARNSTFTYKGKPVKVQQVAKDLGVQYVVEGSVRRADEQVRINVQLIDAATGHHLWAERYDGKMTNIFALQDQINQKIISTLKIKLTAAEKSRIAHTETSNLKAYDTFLRGWEHFKQMTPEVTDRLAQGLIKAGIPEEAYYTVSDDYRIDGDKIRELVFGRTMQILDPMYSVELFFEIATDGKATRSNDNGRFWIDNDMLCFKWQKPRNALGAQWCGPVFKNPRGSPETSDEYLHITDFGIAPHTLVD